MQKKFLKIGKFYCKAVWQFDDNGVISFFKLSMMGFCDRQISSSSNRSSLLSLFQAIQVSRLERGCPTPL